MLNNNASYKNETPYKGPFIITRCFTNGMATLQYSPTKIRYNICQVKTYESYGTVEDINPKDICDDVNI